MMPVLVNKKSGTVLRLGQDVVSGHLKEALGGQLGEVRFMEGGEIAEALHHLGERAAHGVLVGGGDGTAVSVAQSLAKTDIPFGILPLGTMNLLAQDLGAAPTFEETMSRIKRLVPDQIDTGLLNGRMFLCSAVIGFVPEGAIAREALRTEADFETVTNFLGTIARGMGGDIRQKLTLKSRLDDEAYPIDTTSLVVSNNGFVRKPLEAEHRFFRPSLTDGKLAVYSAAPRDMMDGLKMALSLWQGDWQDHGSIRSFETPELVVETQEDKTLVALDGESVEMESPLHFTVGRKSVRVFRMELKD